MAKKQCDISEKIERLKYLEVKRCIEKTEIYDVEIAHLRAEIDYFNYGKNIK